MEIRSVSDAISAVGGASRASQICGVSLDAIRKWREKGCIPPKNWPNLVQHGANLVTYEVLEAIWRQTRPGEGGRRVGAETAPDLQGGPGSTPGTDRQLDRDDRGDADSQVNPGGQVDQGGQVNQGRQVDHEVAARVEAGAGMGAGMKARSGGRDLPDAPERSAMRVHSVTQTHPAEPACSDAHDAATAHGDGAAAASADPEARDDAAADGRDKTAMGKATIGKAATG